jgi:hypothetical protein
LVNRILHDNRTKLRNMSPLTRHVVVLCWNSPGASEANALAIAEFLGAEATFVDVANGAAVPRCKTLVVHAETLARVAGACEAGTAGLDALLVLADRIFIYGFDSTDRDASVLQALSSGGLDGLQSLPATATTFHVAGDHREWCGQFSGLRVGATDATRDACFVEGTPTDRQTVLIRAGDRPIFVRTIRGASELFFLACGELADLEEPVHRETGLLPWFSRLAPLMMFLRGGLGHHVWRNDHPQACFVIDDPLLRNRYGFLEYTRLLRAIRERRFSASIAFIPWNYRRSRRKLADVFSATSGSLSVCVHGCDHTKAEFAASEFEPLRSKAQLALHRMRAHQVRNDLPFDDVMVFPQGLFSSAAIEALDACGYLAAVNTDVCPLDSPSLTLRDYAEVAVTKFSDFPVFERHYPRDPADFAFDLFLGKPALAVEHHGYFRGGYEALETFVTRLNALDSDLEWTNLASICSSASLSRIAENGDTHVRFYTHRFSLTNHGRQTRQYVLFRRCASKTALPGATIDGQQWLCRRDGSDLTITVSLDGGQTVDVGLVDEGPARTTTPPRPTYLHNARVLVRRALCEFRDNYVDTSRVGRTISMIRRNP